MTIAHGKKILLIDNDLEHVALVKTMLEKKGFEVIQTSSIDEGIEKGTKLSFHVIVLNMNFPEGEKNGLDFLNLRKDNPDLLNIPVIAAAKDEAKKEEAIEHGADDFLVKPIKRAGLLEKIAECLVNGIDNAFIFDLENAPQVEVHIPCFYDKVSEDVCTIISSINLSENCLIKPEALFLQNLDARKEELSVVKTFQYKGSSFYESYVDVSKITETISSIIGKKNDE